MSHPVRRSTLSCNMLRMVVAVSDERMEVEKGRKTRRKDGNVRKECEMGQKNIPVGKTSKEI